MGAVCLLFSLYEGIVDNTPVTSITSAANVDEWANPMLAAAGAGMHYKSSAGPRVAALAGAIGAGAVGATYVTSKFGPFGYQFGNKGFLFL